MEPLWDRIAAFARSWGQMGDFNALALELFAYHFANNQPYQRFCRARRATPETVDHWSAIPAVPSEAFRTQTLSCVPVPPPADEPVDPLPPPLAAAFQTSGTTSGAAGSRRHGIHWMDQPALSLYDLSLRTAFHRLASRAAGLPIQAVLAPVSLAPHSSLSYMVSLLTSHSSPLTSHSSPLTSHSSPLTSHSSPLTSHSSPLTSHSSPLTSHSSPLTSHSSPLTSHSSPLTSHFWTPAGPDLALARQQLAEARAPLLLFTTAFGLLELLDSLPQPLPLPEGSFVIETGGFKGRRRQVDRDELYALTAAKLGLPFENIGSEYGMCEMASQFYDSYLSADSLPPHIAPPPAIAASKPLPPVKIGPPWTRSVLIDPATGEPAAAGEPGILRHFDLCNFNSVIALQTADLAIPASRTGAGAGLTGDPGLEPGQVQAFILQGRLTTAPPRGCSLTIEEWVESLPA